MVLVFEAGDSTMHVARSAATAITAFLILPLTATAALAAPPSNDAPAGATVVTMGQTVSQDTTEATADALDDALNVTCGAPAMGASVWFAYTDVTGAGFTATADSADYPAGVLVARGDPADGDLVACAPVPAVVEGPAGSTYYISVFNYSGSTGGNLSFSLTPLPLPPTVSLTVDPKGVAYKDGRAKVSGTYTCTDGDPFFSFIEGTLTQVVGRLRINGTFVVDGLQCDGTTHTWEANVTSQSGLYSGGKAANVSLATACGNFDCALAEVTASVQLSRSGK